MTTDTRDALERIADAAQAVLNNANGNRDSGYANVPWSSIDDLRAALRTPRPESDARDAVPPDFIKSLHAFADAQYVRALDDLRRDPCLGWEHKVKTGKFGKEEFDAHATANKLLGAYCGIYNAVRAALAALTQPEAK